MKRCGPPSIQVIQDAVDTGYYNCKYSLEDQHSGFLKKVILKKETRKLQSMRQCLEPLAEVMDGQGCSLNYLFNKALPVCF